MQQVIVITLLLLLLSLFIVLLSFFKNGKEHYGWSCTYTPNINYYLDSSIIGNSPIVRSITADTIKQF
jgi:hypothetical protein